MEPAGSLPCSQQPETCRTSDSYFFYIHFNIIFPCKLGIPSDLFHFGFPAKSCVHFLFLSRVLHIPPISPILFDMIDLISVRIGPVQHVYESNVMVFLRRFIIRTVGVTKYNICLTKLERRLTLYNFYLKHFSRYEV
jgi:hypothetical protein